MPESGPEISFEGRFVGEVDQTGAARPCPHSVWAPGWNEGASLTERAGSRQRDTPTGRCHRALSQPRTPARGRHRVPGRGPLLTRSAALRGVATPGGAHPGLGLRGGTAWGRCPAGPASSRPTAGGKRVPDFITLNSLESRPRRRAADADSAPSAGPWGPPQTGGLSHKPGGIYEAPLGFARPVHGSSRNSARTQSDFLLHFTFSSIVVFFVSW